MARPDVVLLSGTVVNEQGSRVFLGLSPFGVNGFLRVGGSQYIVSNGPNGLGEDILVYPLGSPESAAVSIKDFGCAVEEFAAELLPTSKGEFIPAPDSAPDAAMELPRRYVRLAVDTDWEFTSLLFQGDTAASSAYATTLIGAISEIYSRDVNTTLELEFLRVWDSDTDPWIPSDDGGDTVTGALAEFHDHWFFQMQDVERDVAQLLCGRTFLLYSGVAWIDGVCSEDYGYSVASSLQGFFPYPLEDYNAQNFDPFLAAHELGHNFGALHTHDLQPPIDQCGFGVCDGTQGTIMSYCANCPGGFELVQMDLHERMVQEKILPFLTNVAPCDLTRDQPVILQQPVSAEICLGSPVSLDVAAAGTAPLAFQWQKDGFDIPGAVSNQFSIEETGETDSGDYQVLITNAFGTIQSTLANILVKDCQIALPPSITTQPKDTEACEGVDVTILAEATGAPPLYYQWHKNGLVISEAQSAELLFPAVTASDDGLYDIVVSNPYGSTASRSATLNTLPCTSPQIRSQGSRYVSVTPSMTDPLSTVAMMITSSTYPCVSRYVDPSGLLVDAPIYLLPAEWGTVMVSGAEIVPAASYELVTLLDDQETGFQSALVSAKTDRWCDVIGIFLNDAWTPPNGIIDFMDILAMVDRFRNLPTAPPLSRCDLHPETPNRVVDFSDVTMVVDAFTGLPYPFSRPTSCGP